MLAVLTLILSIGLADSIDPAMIIPALYFAASPRGASRRCGLRLRRVRRQPRRRRRHRAWPGKVPARSRATSWPTGHARARARRRGTPARGSRAGVAPASTVGSAPRQSRTPPARSTARGCDRGVGRAPDRGAVLRDHRRRRPGGCRGRSDDRAAGRLSADLPRARPRHLRSHGSARHAPTRRGEANRYARSSRATRTG